MSLRYLSAIIAGAVLLGTAGVATAENSKTPGHEMQQKGSYKNEPGASGYTPGHEMQRKGSKRGQPGASGFAPGH